MNLTDYLNNAFDFQLITIPGWVWKGGKGINKVEEHTIKYERYNSYI